jgi:hypothetical protein
MSARRSVVDQLRRRSASYCCAAVATLAGVLAFAMLLAPAVQASCHTRLPVAVSLPDGPYAVAYSRTISVRVDTRGARIGNLGAELYTFAGRRMGASRSQRVRGEATLGLRLNRIFRPLQVGAFTLVLTGEPNRNRSCGPKQATRVLRFRACATTLPVTFPDLPGGRAADYGAYLSVAIRSRGPLISDVRSVVYGVDGTLLGRAPRLSALFGLKLLDHKLVRPLQPGSYTVVTDGLIDGQPRSCGRTTALAKMTFA